ncbi:type II toxin-antitoxin system HipA family toxin [Luteolibacter soli]|uniref:Type II toxin-antitoxin system HipA family toxin n=1 Tax=Luteolibacter soli TaxID=3135280 RepID=A0ABU9ATK1_9BACT
MNLDVSYHDQEVGRLHQDDRGQVMFEYAASWRSGSPSRELSPLYLPNSTTGAVATPTPAFGPLFGLFQDALPDWWGEQMMRRLFDEKGIPWNKVTALQKLACQGDRKIGALAYRPVMDETIFADNLLVELSALVDSARSALKGEAGKVLSELVRSGISPGGARPKSLLWLSKDGRDLQLEPTHGHDAWLIKFDLDPDLHEGRIEHAYMRMAAAAGIEVPESRLIEAAGCHHFMARRFDREPSGKPIHFHSFSGLTHTPVRDGIDYDDLMNLARELTDDHRSVEEVFRRAVFNVLAGNEDDHGRNHAFLMDSDGSWRLSPAFDLTLASNPLTSGYRAGRVMGKGTNVGLKDLIKLGQSHDVRRITEVIAEVQDAISQWSDFANESRLPAGVTTMIRGQLEAMPLT